MSKIFVSIPSYRDPECQHTIKDLLDKASQPLNISVGVCFQYHFEEDIETCFDQWPLSLFDDQIRVDRVDCKLATGPCWARYRAQQLWKGEEFYLSIDSHTRFIQNWDRILLDLLAECPSKKPILTTYPVGYERGKPTPEDPRSTFTCVSKFGPEGMLRLNGRLLSSTHTKPLPASFWVSGFSFSSSNIIKEVPYDPFLQYIFFGEETSMTVRLWTNGWDFFAPGSNIIWHLWSRSYRPVFRENLIDKNIERISFLRIKIMLKMLPGAAENQLNQDSVSQLDYDRAIEDLDKYGLGKVRTLEEYEQFAGVNFRSAKILESAKRGNLDPSMFADHALESVLSLLSSIAPGTFPS